jgi:hypothetical protein
MRYWLLMGMATVLCLSIPVMAANVAQSPDSIIIGNVSIVPGQTQAAMPVYFVTHGEITYYNLPLTIESAGDIHFQGRIVGQALSGWDDNWQGLNNNGNESIQMGFADLGGDDNPGLNTEGRRVEAMELIFTIDENSNTRSAAISPRIDQRAGGPIFGLNNGITASVPTVVEGSLTVNSEVQAKIAALPTEISLSQNFPNPFNPTTDIDFALPEAQTVSLAVFNVLGQQVSQLVSGVQEAGYHKVTWNGKNNDGQPAPSGVYFYRLDAGNFSQSMKMVMLK